MNARVRFIEGDLTEAERPAWEDKFEEVGGWMLGCEGVVGVHYCWFCGRVPFVSSAATFLRPLTRALTD